MVKTGWTRRPRRIALVGALGLVALAAMPPTAAKAQDDDEKTSIWNFDKKILDSVMRGIGLRNGNESQIEYRERSPLVVPPSRELPPPADANTARSAAWPVDPDVKRRQDAAAKRKATNYRGYDPDEEARNLTPSELNPPGTTGATGGNRRASAPVNTNIGDDGKPLQPSELGYFGGLFSSFGGSNKAEVGTFTREPPRSSLTAPPAGYQTPSPEQPYGLSGKTPRPTVTPLDPAVGAVGN
jgi:hypothetical protein